MQFPSFVARLSVIFPFLLSSIKAFCWNIQLLMCFFPLSPRAHIIHSCHFCSTFLSLSSFNRNIQLCLSLLHQNHCYRSRHHISLSLDPWPLLFKAWTTYTRPKFIVLTSVAKTCKVSLYMERYINHSPHALESSYVTRIRHFSSFLSVCLCH